MLCAPHGPDVLPQNMGNRDPGRPLSKHESLRFGSLPVMERANAVRAVCPRERARFRRSANRAPSGSKAGAKML
jgi:hypothetical protein